MTIQKKLLVDALKQVMPGVENGNSVLQGADAFVFHDGRIFSYNDSISVAVPISSAGLVEETIEGAVKGSEFFATVSKFPGDEISFVVTDNNTWILKCGKAKAEMTLMDFDYKSRLEGISPTEDWTEVDESLIAGLNACKMSANKTVLSGIIVNGKDVISTDGFQINRYKMNVELPTFWMSDNSVTELLKIKEITSLQIQNNWVHFKSASGTIFSIKTLEKSKFPIEKITKVMDTTTHSENDFHATFPADLFTSIDRAVAFGMDISGHTSVRLDLSPKHIEVSAQTATGKYNEKVAWDSEVGEFENISLYVDVTMMTFMAQRSLEFYILNREGSAPRLLFVTENSTHLLSTFKTED